jgi:hypothetical protein
VKLHSSNPTLSDQSGAHLSSQLPFVHLLQSLRRDPQGCRARGGTCGNESGGHVLALDDAVDGGRGLDICVCGRHATRSRNGFRSRTWARSLFPFLEGSYRPLITRPEVAGAPRRPPGTWDHGGRDLRAGLASLPSHSLSMRWAKGSVQLLFHRFGAALFFGRNLPSFQRLHP